MNRLLAAVRQPHVLLLAILALALALRLFGLTYHSLWLDESVSVKWGRMATGDILAHTTNMREDAHPPLSYLALHAWIRVFGDGEESLRGHVAVLGFLLVILVYLLGKELAGRRAGLIAGLLAAINPYLIWYSQEVRMYALLGTLTAASAYCLWRGLETGRLRWWGCYVLAAVGGIYTSIIGVLVVPFHGLAVLLSLRGQRKNAAGGLIAVALVSLAFVPLAMVAWQASGVITTERAAPTILSLLTTAPVILLLRQVPSGWQLLAVPGVALAVVGILWATRRNLRRGLFLILYLVVPLALIFALSVWRLPIFGPPYIIIAAAPLLLAVALGVEALWQRRRAAGAAALCVLCLISLVGVRYDWDRSMGKEDWRAAAQYITAHAGPNDAILAMPYYASLPLSYYYRGPLPILQPFSDPVKAEAIAPALQGIEQYDTVWLVWSHGEQLDPAGLVRNWLYERYPEMTEQYPRGVEVRAFAVRYRQPAAAGATVLGTFGGRLALLSAQADATVIAHDDIYHPPSGWVHVRLAWQRLGGGDLSGLAVGLRVTDSLGQVWGERLDRATEVWRLYPPARWQPNEAVRDEYDINMNPRTPRGRYRVELQVLDNSGQPLPVQAEGMPAERYFVADVEVR
jgi:4-amino-4-deoxy-L-arabinose transferase-like glycosyltransferase